MIQHKRLIGALLHQLNGMGQVLRINKNIVGKAVVAQGLDARHKGRPQHEGIVRLGLQHVPKAPQLGCFLYSANFSDKSGACKSVHPTTPLMKSCSVARCSKNSVSEDSCAA